MKNQIISAYNNKSQNMLEENDNTVFRFAFSALVNDSTRKKQAELSLTRKRPKGRKLRKAFLSFKKFQLTKGARLYIYIHHTHTPIHLCTNK